MERVKRERIVGYEIDCVGPGALISELLDIVLVSNEVSRCRWLACLNPHSYVVALSDETFSKALKQADWLVPDGSGIVFASKILGGSIRERITGSDVFTGVCKELNAVGRGKIFFLGSSGSTLSEIVGRFRSDYPNLEIVGTYSPPYRQVFSERETSAMLAAVNSSRADVLWVGLTAPKQEKWIYENSHLLEVRFAAGIGAVFDFYAGRVKRSHPLVQKFHLEWLPRLLREPKRLWRRTVISAPVFVWDVLKQRYSAQEEK